MNIKKILSHINKGNFTDMTISKYCRRFDKFSFKNGNCSSEKQYEGCITRLYHTIEKGLSFEKFRAGFGKGNLELLLNAMEHYSMEYGYSSDFYRTALDVLYKYIKKNQEYGYTDKDMETRIKSLPGEPNGKGGIVTVKPWTKAQIQSASYEALLKNRHSIRHFSDEKVDERSVIEAVELAQYTPSACNRQGWKTHIITHKEIIEKVLKNQNGNRGFGQEINILLLITADLCYFNHDREIFQPFIDGGMYAMNIINSLHYNHLGTIPLSASLAPDQEENVRGILNLDASEVLILFIGVGNYPRSCLAPKSERHSAVYVIH